LSSYLIKKIFGPTLQGEGSLVGTVVKFVRFSGCNRWSGHPSTKPSSVCFFCDTDFYGGEKLSATEILNQLNSMGDCRRVVLSGGEPTLQINEELLHALKNQGYFVLLETNGSVNIDHLSHLIDHISVSPKQSAEETKLTEATDLKILYPSPIPNVNPNSFTMFKATHKFVQPLEDLNWSDNIKTSIAFCCKNPDWRLSLQTHKTLGVE
jgi:7-carboxy-7-deazaguanine synthase